jgi:alpha-L-rhamnosidase
VGLKCEYRVDPLGIDEGAPRLSWALESEGRGQVQSAYRILAARSEENLEAEESLLWDSGRVESGRSVGVEYEGEALRSRSRCVWKVRVWDGAGDPSPYSGPAVFEAGFLERSDWKGGWISLGKKPDEDFEPPTGEDYDDLANGLAPSPYLRKEFPLDKPVRRARLYATARGLYELHLNGSRVGDDVLAPGWTDYDRRVQYQTYDVTPLLAEGQNTLGAVLGDGWYAGFVGFDPKHRGAHYGTRPQLLAQLHVEYEDGSTESIASDSSWRCSTGPILHSDLLMGESYDAREEMPGWSDPGFDDSAWYGVKAEEMGDTNLVAQPDEGIRVTEELGAKSVTEPEDGVYVFDMGKNMVGWVRLRVEGEAGTEITLRGGLRAALHLPRLPLRRGHGLSGRAPTRGGHRPRRPLGHTTYGVLRVLEPDGQRAAGEHPLGSARQFPQRADRLPAARRAPRLDGGRAGLRPHRLLQHGRRRLLREMDGRRRGRPVSRRRLP